MDDNGDKVRFAQNADTKVTREVPSLFCNSVALPEANGATSHVSQLNTQTQPEVGMPPSIPTHEPKTNLDAWIFVPWVVPFLTLYCGYKLGQFSTRTNNIVTLTLADVNTFRSKIEEYNALVKMHQRGTPVANTTTLNQSREHLTNLRKEAASIQRQMQEALKTATDQNEWKVAYFDWKQSTEGDSGLIMKKVQAWSADAITKLDEASDSYLKTINRFRRQIASHKIKLCS